MYTVDSHEKMNIRAYADIFSQIDEGVSLHGIAASKKQLSSKKKQRPVKLAKKKGLVCPLDEEMTDQ